MTRVVSMLLVVLLAGCTEVRVIVAPDAGGSQAEHDAAIEPDVGPPVEPAPGSECDQQDDCGTCMECSVSPHETCNREVLLCEDDPECVGLATCVGRCDADATACLRACVEAHPAGRDPLVQLYTCMLCDACPADCRVNHASWCLAPPF